MEWMLRFLIGGLVVSIFSALAEISRPKSFAGLFGAAPSIALATLGITMHRHGPGYAAEETRTMILGAFAFLVYASAVSWFVIRRRQRALFASLILLPLWFVASASLWMVLAR